jgi:hypothetical protein
MSDEIVPSEIEAVIPESTQEEVKVETPSEDTVESQEEPKPQADEKKFTQSELDEIIQKRIAKESARAERRALKVYADKLEKMAAERQTIQTTPSPDGKPTMAQYANVEDYVEAVSDWKLNQREQQTQKQQAEEQQKQFLDKTEKIYAQAEKIRGFDRDAFDDLPLTNAIAQAIVDSEVAPKLMAYFVNNPEDVSRIANLNPVRQIAEIGKLEAKVSEVAVKPVTVSKAPAPIEPIGTRGSSNKDPSEMTDLEFAKWRKAQIAQRR